jgi:hypothetical protein
VHCADHAQRHVGQLVTTAKVVVGMRRAGDSRRMGEWLTAVPRRSEE